MSQSILNTMNSLEENQLIYFEEILAILFEKGNKI